ncbi:MAG: SGNH/GDSL hydrolase family protein [Planctomycetota bacterium]|nr:SGNH/GDSL hydrolase family protein [Planctomycetota bacterium]
MSEPVRTTRPVWKKLLLAFVLTLVLLEVGVELGSRWADRVLAKRALDPAYKAPGEVAQFDLWDRLAYLTLEYGSPKRGLEQTGARSAPHPYLGYALIPNYKTAPGATQQVSHNALGFRGKETTWEKPPGVFRIVTTGGSSVYGQSESSDAAVWSQKLEDMLQAARPGFRIEVVNLGVSGWSTHEMLINLALRGLDLAPDLVIVYEAINDMRCALYTPGGEVQHDNTHWRQAWPTDRPSAIEGIAAKSRTYLVFRRWFTDYAAARVDLGFYAIRNYKPNFETDPYLHAPNPTPQLGFANTRRNLTGIVALCRSRGAQVLFATQALPRWHLDRHASRGDQVAGFEHVIEIERALARDLDVPIVESGALVEASCEAEVAQKIAEAVAAAPDRPRAEIEAEWRRPGRRDLLFFQEVHPNDRGSELLARTIADYLLASPLVPR